MVAIKHTNTTPVHTPGVLKSSFRVGREAAGHIAGGFTFQAGGPSRAKALKSCSITYDSETSDREQSPVSQRVLVVLED